jgi:hypothetical protein
MSRRLFNPGQLQDQIQSLKDQLAQRPPLEQVQTLQREYRNLELILQGTQRENEKCMAELERHELTVSQFLSLMPLCQVKSEGEAVGKGVGRVGGRKLAGVWQALTYPFHSHRPSAAEESWTQQSRRFSC